MGREVSQAAEMQAVHIRHHRGDERINPFRDVDYRNDFAVLGMIGMIV